MGITGHRPAPGFPFSSLPSECPVSLFPVSHIVVPILASKYLPQSHYSASISFRAQSLMVRSWLPDTIHLPSRETSTELMGAVCDSSELMRE